MFKCKNFNAVFSSALKFKKHGHNPCYDKNNDYNLHPPSTLIAPDFERVHDNNLDSMVATQTNPSFTNSNTISFKKSSCLHTVLELDDTEAFINRECDVTTESGTTNKI